MKSTSCCSPRSIHKHTKDIKLYRISLYLTNHSNNHNHQVIRKVSTLQKWSNFMGAVFGKAKVESDHNSNESRSKKDKTHISLTRMISMPSGQESEKHLSTYKRESRMHGSEDSRTRSSLSGSSRRSSARRHRNSSQATSKTESFITELNYQSSERPMSRSTRSQKKSKHSSKAGGHKNPHNLPNDALNKYSKSKLHHQVRSKDSEIHERMSFERRPDYRFPHNRIFRRSGSAARSDENVRRFHKGSSRMSNQISHNDKEVPKIEHRHEDNFKEHSGKNRFSDLKHEHKRNSSDVSKQRTSHGTRLRLSNNSNISQNTQKSVHRSKVVSSPLRGSHLEHSGGQRRRDSKLFHSHSHKSEPRRQYSHSRVPHDSSDHDHYFPTRTSVVASSTLPSSHSGSSQSKHHLPQVSRTTSYLLLPEWTDPYLGCIPRLHALHHDKDIVMEGKWRFRKGFHRSCHTIRKLVDFDHPVLLLIGGINPKAHGHYELGASLMLYDPVKNHWCYYGLLPEPRHLHGSFYHHGKIYVVGGYSSFIRSSGEMVASPNVYRMCLKSNHWERVADITDGRAAFALVILSGKAYVFGGRNANGRIVHDVEAYHPSKDYWEPLRPLPVPLMGHAAVCHDGLIYVMGGITAPTHPEDPECKEILPRLSDTVFCYHPKENSWSQCPSLSEPRAFFSAVSLEHRITLWSGVSSSFQPKHESQLDVTPHHTPRHAGIVSMDTVDCYDPKTGETFKVRRLGLPRHSVALCKTGNLLVGVGGMSTVECAVLSETTLLQVPEGTLDFYKEHLLGTEVILGMPFPSTVAGAVLVEIPSKSHKIQSGEHYSKDQVSSDLDGKKMQVEIERNQAARRIQKGYRSYKLLKWLRKEKKSTEIAIVGRGKKRFKQAVNNTQGILRWIQVLAAGPLSSVTPHIQRLYRTNQVLVVRGGRVPDFSGRYLTLPRSSKHDFKEIHSAPKHASSSQPMKKEAGGSRSHKHSSHQHNVHHVSEAVHHVTHQDHGTQSSAHHHHHHGSHERHESSVGPKTLHLSSSPSYGHREQKFHTLQERSSLIYRSEHGKDREIPQGSESHNQDDLHHEKNKSDRHTQGSVNQQSLHSDQKVLKVRETGGNIHHDGSHPGHIVHKKDRSSHDPREDISYQEYFLHDHSNEHNKESEYSTDLAQILQRTHQKHHLENTVHNKPRSSTEHETHLHFDLSKDHGSHYGKSVHEIVSEGHKHDFQFLHGSRVFGEDGAHHEYRKTHSHSFPKERDTRHSVHDMHGLHSDHGTQGALSRNLDHHEPEHSYRDEHNVHRRNAFHHKVDSEKKHHDHAVHNGHGKHETHHEPEIHYDHRVHHDHFGHGVHRSHQNQGFHDQDAQDTNEEHRKNFGHYKHGSHEHKVHHHHHGYQQQHSMPDEHVHHHKEDLHKEHGFHQEHSEQGKHREHHDHGGQYKHGSHELGIDHRHHGSQSQYGVHDEKMSEHKEDLYKDHGFHHEQAAQYKDGEHHDHSRHYKHRSHEHGIHDHYHGSQQQHGVHDTHNSYPKKVFHKEHGFHQEHSVQDKHGEHHDRGGQYKHGPPEHEVHHHLHGSQQQHSVHDEHISHHKDNLHADHGTNHEHDAVHKHIKHVKHESHLGHRDHEEVGSHHKQGEHDKHKAHHKHVSHHKHSVHGDHRIFLDGDQHDRNGSYNNHGPHQQQSVHDERMIHHKHGSRNEHGSYFKQAELQYHGSQEQQHVHDENPHGAHSVHDEKKNYHHQGTNMDHSGHKEHESHHKPDMHVLHGNHHTNYGVQDEHLVHGRHNEHESHHKRDKHDIHGTDHEEGKQKHNDHGENEEHRFYYKHGQHGADHLTHHEHGAHFRHESSDIPNGQEERSISGCRKYCTEGGHKCRHYHHTHRVVHHHLINTRLEVLHRKEPEIKEVPCCVTVCPEGKQFIIDESSTSSITWTETDKSSTSWTSQSETRNSTNNGGKDFHEEVKFSRLPPECDPNLVSAHKYSCVARSSKYSGDLTSTIKHKITSNEHYREGKTFIGGEGPTILLIGGHNPVYLFQHNISSVVLQYNPFENRWTFYNTIPSPRCYHGAAILDNKVYVVGGCKSSSSSSHVEQLQATADLFVLDLTSGHWTIMKPMTTPRAYHGVAAVLGKVYAIGGRNHLGCLLNNMECYDPLTNKWTLLDTYLPEPVIGPAASEYLGLLWIIGGLTYSEENGDFNATLNEHVYYYDPEINKLVTADPLLGGRAFSSAIAFNNNGGLWLTGGCKGFAPRAAVVPGCSSSSSLEQENDNVLKSADNIFVMDVKEFEWSELPLKMAESRHAAASAVVGPCVYHFGGMSSATGTAPLSSVELIVFPGHREDLQPEPLPVGLTGCTAVVVPANQALEDTQLMKTLSTALWATNVKKT